MTAPLLTSYSASSSASAFLGRRSTALKSGSLARSANQASHQLSTYLFGDRDSASNASQMPNSLEMLSGLMELLPQGVIVISRTLKPVFWNRKAKQLCGVLANGDYPNGNLPLIISEISQRLIRDRVSPGRSLIVEHQALGGQNLRLSASWLDLPSKTSNVRFSNQLLMSEDTQFESSEEHLELIAVFLENCDEVMQKEMQIQQEKYDLTDREAEIWMLIRQEYTYLEIAQQLQISLNTVKTHVKNVYAKRRSYQGTEKFWCHGA